MGKQFNFVKLVDGAENKESGGRERLRENQGVATSYVTQPEKPTIIGSTGLKFAKRIPLDRRCHGKREREADVKITLDIRKVAEQLRIDFMRAEVMRVDIEKLRELRRQLRNVWMLSYVLEKETENAVVRRIFRDVNVAVNSCEVKLQGIENQISG